MTALASPGCVTKEYTIDTAIRSYPVDALSQIWEGGIVVLDTTGYAAAGTSGTSLIAVGIAQESVLGTAVDGGVNITVHQGTGRYNADSAFAQTAVGGLCYIVDDNTVSVTSTNRSVAGLVAAVDGNYVWVTIGLFAPNANAAVTSLTNNLALTTTPGGASYVGIYDVAALITATEVEDALAEIVKKANAALAVPVSNGTILSTATSGSTVFKFVPGYAGKIQTLDGSVQVAATTTGKAATFQVFISDTAVTGAALTLTQVNCATLGARISGVVATGSNSFTATQAISIQVSAAAAAFSEGEANLLLFLASA